MAALALFAILNSLLCIPTFNANQSIELRSKRSGEVSSEMAATTLTVARKHWRVLCTSALFCSFLILVRRARELFFALEGHRLGLSSSLIGSIWAVSFAVDGMLFPLAGWMLDRVGRVRTGALSMLGLGASLLILHGDTFTFYLAFAVVSGLFNSISAGLLQVLSADLAPAEGRSQFIGIFSTLSLCADIAGSAVVGAVAEVTGLKTAGTIMAMAGAVGAVFGLSFMRETANFSSKETAEALHPHTKAAEIGKKDEDGLAAAELGCATGPAKQV
jgi:MFS family permease